MTHFKLRTLYHPSCMCNCCRYFLAVVFSRCGIPLQSGKPAFCLRQRICCPLRFLCTQKLIGNFLIVIIQFFLCAAAFALSTDVLNTRTRILICIFNSLCSSHCHCPRGAPGVPVKKKESIHISLTSAKLHKIITFNLHDMTHPERFRNVNHTKQSQYYCRHI